MSRLVGALGAMIAGLGAFFALKKTSGSVAAAVPFLRARAVLNSQGSLSAVFSAPASRNGGPLSFEEAKTLALKVTSQYFPSVDPKMLVAMMEVESTFNPRAVRVEPHVRNEFTSDGDSSYGIMQTLWTTALWLYRDMGARAFSVATAQRLFDPLVSVYFGAAYVNWLLRWRGKPRSEDWIVMSYNGGPGADNIQTRHHLVKYHAAKNKQAGGW